MVESTREEDFLMADYPSTQKGTMFEVEVRALHGMRALASTIAT